MNNDVFYQCSSSMASFKSIDCCLQVRLVVEEWLGEMRKGRRERMRMAAIVSSSPQGMTSWSSSIKICFFQAYRMHY